MINEMTTSTLSSAHRRSAAAIIDPAYSAEALFPSKPRQENWLYSRGEYEAFVLTKMRRVVKELRLFVGYPGVFRPPASRAFFRLDCPAAGEVVFSVRGRATASFDGLPLALPSSDSVDMIRLALPKAGKLIIEVESDDLTAYLPSLASDGEAAWLASVDGETFAPAVPGGLPTGDELPRIDVPVKETAPGFFDSGREILADISFGSPEKPVFTVGESCHEALHVTPETAEQSFDLIPDGQGGWKTPLPLAFRYLRVVSPAGAQPRLRAAYTPLCYRGAFAADEELNRIWMSSAYTLRLCIDTFQIDGIKRDRLPWAGDLAISLLSNSYVFHEAEPIRRTLTVLGRDGLSLSQVNGMVDYSLWVVICHDLYQLYFGDLPFLRENYEAIHSILDDLIARAERHGGFLAAEGEESIFIDWLQMAKTTALQMLFHWALRSGAALARRMGDGGRASAYLVRASSLRDLLVKEVLDPSTGLFRSAIEDPASPPVRHANFLAILSGVADAGQGERIASSLLAEDLPPVGTPYMAALELLALHRTGHSTEALAKLRKIWGGMLRLGATTFFEGYRADYDEETMCVFYQRPFGASLCHAWSSAPAALLPILVFGAEPASDGFRDLRLKAEPLLPSASLTLPTGFRIEP